MRKLDSISRKHANFPFFVNFASCFHMVKNTSYDCLILSRENLKVVDLPGLFFTGSNNIDCFT